MANLRNLVTRAALVVLGLVALLFGAPGLAQAAPPDCVAEVAQARAVQIQIEAHNAKPHVFYLPQQAAQYHAYNAEAAKLNAARAKVLANLQACTGPGKWGKGKNNGSARSKKYEEQVTGQPVGISYYVKGVEFDGFRNGVLLDAKGPGYWKLIREPWAGEPAKLLTSARNQLRAAGKTPIEWRFAEKEAADFMRPLLRGIKVVFEPPRF